MDVTIHASFLPIRRTVRSLVLQQPEDVADRELMRDGRRLV